MGGTPCRGAYMDKTNGVIRVSMLLRNNAHYHITCIVYCKTLNLVEMGIYEG